MPRTSSSEAALDNLLAEALRDRPAFASWFLNQTRFAGAGVEGVEVRADNPWSRVTLSLPPNQDGLIKELTRDCETDVLAIFLTSDGRRLALHIENKLENGAFTPYQPETYRERLEQWRRRPKLGMYIEATSVLIAPQAFYDKNHTAAQVFEAFVAHEAIAVHLQAFARGGGSAA